MDQRSLAFPLATSTGRHLCRETHMVKIAAVCSSDSVVDLNISSSWFRQPRAWSLTSQRDAGELPRGPRACFQPPQEVLGRTPM